jgi:broad-specificity NMP kinase
VVVIINGSFGSGKTTVANFLRKSLPGSVIYDPEWAGFVLRRLPGWIRLEGAGTDDYQNIRLWRKSVALGTRLFRSLADGPVIIPMTFSDRVHFDEIITGIRSFEADLKVFCLRASLATVRSRLMQRGIHLEGVETEWIARRVVECAEAHLDPHFGEPIETDDRLPPEITREIIEKLRPPYTARDEVDQTP